MKAIILAAWEWSRLRPLTDTTPKPLIKIFGKPIIEHTMDSLHKYVDEFIIVVKYRQSLFREKLWNKYKKTPITYVEQWDEAGTWAAIKWIKVKWDFVILNWDSIFDKDDLEKICKLKWYGCLVKKVDNPEKYWIFKLNKKDEVVEVVEKPSTFIWDLANMWVYKVNHHIIDYLKEVELSPRWEIELTCGLNIFLKSFPFELKKMKWEFIDIGYPWDILTANSHFLNKLKKSKKKWKVEKNVTINGNVILWKWSVLKSWTYIEWNVYIWENSIIWPNIYIRWNTVIWDNCRLGNWNEIKNSSIWDYTNIAHLSYVWDSVIWNHVNIWWGFITANLRHDWTNIKIPVKWVLTDSWLRKFGCIIWDNTKTWINTSTYPGRIIWSSSFTNPWEIIK